MGDAVLKVLEAVFEGCDAEQAMHFATDYGIDATLYRYAKELGYEPRPEWAHQWRWHVAETMLRRRELCEVARALEQEIGQVLVLKGEPLAVRLYGDGLARRSGDLDVMCAPQDVESAWRALMRWGCQPLHAERPEPWLYNQWACARPGTGRVIELHWALSAPEVEEPSFEAFYARSEEQGLGREGSVRVLGDRDQLLQTAYHYHHHMGFLKGLLDVAAWWDTCGVEELGEVMREARACGVEEVVKWPLIALESLIDEEIGNVSHKTGWVRAFGAWSAWSTRGAASRAQGSEAGLLGFKTQGVAQTEVVAWRVLGAMLLSDSLRRGFSIVFGSPERHCVARGGEDVTWQDWGAWVQEVMGKMEKGAKEITRRA